MIIFQAFIELCSFGWLWAWNFICATAISA
jgi:hypothetical protein